jgi:hypothetical protein
MRESVRQHCVLAGEEAVTNPADILRLFNEKAEKLERSAFTEFVRSETLGFTMQQKGDFVDIYVQGPHPELVDAFVLTLRFFVQDNEPTSLRRLDALYDTLPIPGDLVVQTHEGRATLNRFLDETSHMIVAGKELTNRQVFEVFLWGGLAHANPEKKQTFDAWAADDSLFPLMQMTFHQILVELFNFIAWQREHNTIALAKMDVA